MNINIQGYLDTIQAPWGQLFYKMIWHNLPFKGMEILDFGSGFGITADYLATNNRVTAIEPNEEMVANRRCDHTYDQIIGGIEQLKEIQSHFYDMIICHNVLEYMNDREAVFQEFHRLLKDNGTLSLVKHNRAGKIMQKVVFENKIDEAIDLIEDKAATSVNFGKINEYSLHDLEKYTADLYNIHKVYGVRMFFGLQRNEFKAEPEWMQNMFRFECAVEETSQFRDIAFFHHVILKKLKKGEEK